MKSGYKNIARFLILASALISFSSCSAVLPKLTKDTVDSRKITYMGSIAMLVNLTKLQTDKTADGKLRIKLNFTNITFAPRRNIWVEVMATFKDADGFVIENTPWEPILVNMDSDSVYSSVSHDAHAKDFTVSIRKR